jgi:hypothetical protein
VTPGCLLFDPGYRFSAPVAMTAPVVEVVIRLHRLSLMFWPRPYGPVIERPFLESRRLVWNAGEVR